ncbi:MAG: hypothetical protein UZ11_BCD004001681 [Bacteroidetes bacterium OLB11]|nr:MAG: hypothetical protein UZ11_BCD004001681 [Bacteroidetes bacterium OLB11]
MPTILGKPFSNYIFHTRRCFDRLSTGTISTNNEARFIDAFVDKLDLKMLEIKSLCQDNYLKKIA